MQEQPSYPISHVRSVSFQQPEAPPVPDDKIVVEAHCVVDSQTLPRSMTTTRRFKLIGTLLALLLYRLLVVSLVISLGTYAYNIKEANLPLASVYRTTWSLTVVSIILLLVELGVIGGYYTYISKKVLS